MIEKEHNGIPFVWIAGNRLTSIWDGGTPHYFCVVTAYEKDVALKEILRYPLPIADGYEGFWKPYVTIQNPLAEIEIVRWDATFLLIISKEKEVIERFAKEYPNSMDLAEYNQSAE